MNFILSGTAVFASIAHKNSNLSERFKGYSLKIVEAAKAPIHSLSAINKKNVQAAPGKLWTEVSEIRKELPKDLNLWKNSLIFLAGAFLVPVIAKPVNFVVKNIIPSLLIFAPTFLLHDYYYSNGDDSLIIKLKKKTEYLFNFYSILTSSVPTDNAAQNKD